MKRFGLSQDGMTVLSALIGAGLTTVILGALGQFSIMSAKMQKKMNDSFESEAMMHTSMMLLRRQELCGCNFSGKAFRESNIANARFALHELRSFDTTGGTCTPGPVIASTRRPVGGVRVSSIRLGDFSKVSDSFYLAELNIETMEQNHPRPHKVRMGLATTTVGDVVTVDGCSVGQEQVAVESERVANGEVVPEIAGYNKRQCALTLTPEAMNLGPTWRGSTTNGFADWGQWGDNHYAGAQSFYDTNWRVTCRFGFTNRDTTNPIYVPGVCRYTLVCRR